MSVMMLQMQKKKALRRRGSIDDDLAMYLYNMSVSIIVIVTLHDKNKHNALTTNFELRPLP